MSGESRHRNLRAVDGRDERWSVQIGAGPGCLDQLRMSGSLIGTNQISGRIVQSQVSSELKV